MDWDMFFMFLVAISPFVTVILVALISWWGLVSLITGGGW